MITRLFVVAVPMACAVVAYLTARNYRLDIPALGVFDNSDLWMLAGAIVVLPIQYWLMPGWASTVLFSAVILNSVYVLTRRLRIRALRFALAVIPLAAVHVLSVLDGASAASTVWVGNLVLAAVVTSIVTVWVQTGMNARHAVIMCAGLTIYDVCATSIIGFMAPLADRLTQTTPAAAFRLPHGGASLGLGDVLISTLIPAAFDRSHGSRAARIAFATTAAAFEIAAVVPVDIFPVLATLGPITIALYAYVQRHPDRRLTAAALA